VSKSQNRQKCGLAPFGKTPTTYDRHMILFGGLAGLMSFVAHNSIALAETATA
jgi:hypothetical protein